MKLIPLTQGKFAMVDDEDFERVNRFKWQYHSGYAKRSVRIGPRRQNKTRAINMGNFVLNDSLNLIDHVDSNGCNNQKSNLRPANKTQNAANRRVFSKIGLKGVSFRKNCTSNPYWAQITVNKKTRSLGGFPTAFEAAIAYDVAAISAFGSFAKTNSSSGLIPCH